MEESMVQARRRLLLTAALALASAPRVSVAQQKAKRIAILVTPSRATTGDRVHGGLIEALRQSGWIEGRNLVVDWRYADGRLEMHDPLARELVALGPDVIATPPPTS